MERILPFYIKCWILYTYHILRYIAVCRSFDESNESVHRMNIANKPQNTSFARAQTFLHSMVQSEIWSWQGDSYKTLIDSVMVFPFRRCHITLTQRKLEFDLFVFIQRVRVFQIIEIHWKWNTLSNDLSFVVHDHWHLPPFPLFCSLLVCVSVSVRSLSA